MGGIKVKNRKNGIRFMSCVVTAAALLAGGTVMPASAGDTDRLAAFPGAEGGGMYATGARGAENPEIYHVTNLNDSGRGSLRDAVSQSDRIIVFDVAGNIELVNALSIIGDNLTILGQTAPGDGICIKNNTVGVFGDNVIIRYLRFRMGDELTVEDDSIGGRGLNNVIIDHCSISWSVDECASFYENTNFTMQWCIVAESLKESIHGKGNHGYGGIWGGQNASYHHNLLAHHDSRNPRIATAGIEAAKDDVTLQTDLTDLRNNVIYNWGGNSAYGGENGAPVNIINCYYKPGPSTGSGKEARLFQITAKEEGDTTGTNNLNCPGWGTDLYVSGNYVYGSTAVTNDNTKGVVTDSNTTTYGLWTDSTITEDEKTVHNRYISDYPVTTQTAQEAYEAVLAGAGASISRDSVDTAIVNDVKNGTGSLINTPSDAGGYPTLAGTKAKDTDNDGIPNEWEDANGLDKYNGSDALTLSEDGYTRLEEYANALADGSYVRDTEYDPDVPDYEPEEETEEPDATPAPEKKLINRWIAAAGDESKAAGTELMPGLTNVIELTRAMTDTVTFEDGSVFNYAITHKDTNGKWSNGAAAGTALKYTAPQDGVFTLYAYSVSGTKTFYAIREGAENPDVNPEAAAYIQECIGTAVPIICSIDVKAGETYYFYLAGSKARFCSAKLEEYVTPATEVPKNKTYTVSDVSASGFTVTKNADTDTGSAALIARYNADNRLIGVTTRDIELSVGESESFNFDWEDDTESVRVFIWNSADGMEPLASE